MSVAEGKNGLPPPHRTHEGRAGEAVELLKNLDDRCLTKPAVSQFYMDKKCCILQQYEKARWGDGLNFHQRVLGPSRGLEMAF